MDHIIVFECVPLNVRVCYCLSVCARAFIYAGMRVYMRACECLFVFVLEYVCVCLCVIQVHLHVFGVCV